MILETGLGLLGSATSLVGLFWPEKGRELARKRILGILAVLGLLVATDNWVRRSRIDAIVQRIVASSSDWLSADQLYQRMPASTPRALFDAALLLAIEQGSIADRQLELRTADGAAVLVRVYYTD